MAPKRLPVPPPADAAAMGICIMARVVGRLPTPGIASVVENLHPQQGCRFCKQPVPELVTILDRYRAEIDESFDDFAKLPRAAQRARVREAQQDPWWEGVAVGR